MAPSLSALWRIPPAALPRRSAPPETRPPSNPCAPTPPPRAPPPTAGACTLPAASRGPRARVGPDRTPRVATSAERDAKNGQAFLGEIEWGYGFAARLVTGDDEALLTRRGVQPAAGTLVLDIG